MDLWIDRYKGRLVAKGYTQTYDIVYFGTFSPVARMNSIKILFSIAVNLSWPLFKLDVKNTFLYGDLQEEVYMEQPPSYVAQGETKVLSSKEGYIWTQAEFNDVVWEVYSYHFWYWLSLMSFRSLRLRSAHKVWHYSFGYLCWWYFCWL